MERIPISADQVNMAFRVAQTHMADVLNRKGPGTFASTHEILGVLEDERRELVKAVQAKQPLADIRHELLDQAVICIFGVACMDAGALDW